VRLTLGRSGVTFTSVREGIYAEAFPLFLNYYPSTTDIYLPSDGQVAFTSRTELGEATAKLMVQGGDKNQIVLLTAPKAYSLEELVTTINKVSGRNLIIHKVPFQEYVTQVASNDEGCKSVAFFEAWKTFFDGITNGDAAATDPLMEQLMGRKPKDGVEVVTDLLTESPDYTWHQNYAKKL
jgi:hypothetical protein